MVGRRRRVLPGTVGVRRAVVGVALLAVAVVLLIPTARGFTLVETVAGPDGRLPVRVYVPDGAAPASAAGVVVAHGFAGSAALMHAWSSALAHAGLVVVAPDLPGHGANAAPIGEGAALADAVVAAVGHLVTVPEVDVERLGLLGHSMGSGAALDAGIQRPDLIDAVVAVSPTDAEVSAEVPRDLLLLAGENEPRFVANAESLLARAGGPGGAPGDGDARRLEVVPLVEHVSILFSRTAHDASIDWLAAALDHAPSGSAPTGPLLGWGVLVLALLLIWRALVAEAATPAGAPDRRGIPWLALPLGGVAATASLVIITRSFDVVGVTGVLVAGELGLWFLMAGTVWLRFGIRPAAPEARDAGWALLTLLLLVGIGASATLAWAPWWLTGPRVLTAVLLAALLLPFSIAAAAMLHGRRGARALGAWLATSLAVLLTLGAASAVVPGVGFLLLVLPLLPVVLGVTTLVGVEVDRPWATGVANAVFLGWLFAMLFPVA